MVFLSFIVGERYTRERNFEVEKVRLRVVCAGVLMAMRCAERTGSCTILWQHEFYMVKEPRYGAYLYQAVEFRVGINLAADEVEE